MVQRRKDTALGASCAVGPGPIISHLYILFPVRQEVCDPPASGVRQVQLGELVLKQRWDDDIECRAEVYKQDPGRDSRCSDSRLHLVLKSVLSDLMTTGHRYACTCVSTCVSSDHW